MAKVGTAWATQYDPATGVAATVGGYTGSIPMVLFVCGDY
jgi:hypothetical protein